MVVLTPKVPSRRNIEIYYAVHARQRRQVDVAKQEQISQSRVSRICAEVKHWIALGKPGQCHSVAAQAFIAADLWNARLAFYEQQAAAAFAATCHAPADNAGEGNAKAKPPRPDARLLKQAVDCAREQFALVSVLAKAHQEVHDQSRHDPLYEEEMTVSRAVATCERASELHYEFSRRGVQLPSLPKFDVRAIELFARNRWRREQTRESETHNYLPPEWLAVVNAVEQAPLAYDGQEVMPPPAEEDISLETPEPPAAENVQAYGDDCSEAAETEPVVAQATPTPVAAPASQPVTGDLHFDYTVLARRHKPASHHPPIRWFRMT